MKLWPPEWIPDCQGKWDYDAAVIYVSTRYWPRGGGMSVLNTMEPEKGFRTNEDHTIRPSAHSSLIFGRVSLKDDDNAVLVEKEFEGDTEEEVKEAVEKWVAEQYVNLKQVMVSAGHKP